MCFGNAFGGNCTWILFIIVLILLCNDRLRLRLWLLIPFIWAGGILNRISPVSLFS